MKGEAGRAALQVTAGMTVEGRTGFTQQDSQTGREGRATGLQNLKSWAVVRQGGGRGPTRVHTTGVNSGPWFS